MTSPYAHEDAGNNKERGVSAIQQAIEPPRHRHTVPVASSTKTLQITASGENPVHRVRLESKALQVATHNETLPFTSSQSNNRRQGEREREKKNPGCTQGKKKKTTTKKYTRDRLIPMRPSDVHTLLSLYRKAGVW